MKSNGGKHAGRAEEDFLTASILRLKAGGRWNESLMTVGNDAGWILKRGSHPGIDWNRIDGRQGKGGREVERVMWRTPTYFRPRREQKRH